jgi:hypothetical protein
VQWYGRLPASEKMMGALSWPGSIVPVSKSLPVAVWAIESALCQTTVCPTFTVDEAGENDMPSAMPLIVIVTCVAGVGVGAGVGWGVGTGVGIGAGVGVGAGPVVPPGELIGGSEGAGSGLGVGGSMGVGVGDGAGVGFGAGVGVEAATGGVLATGEDVLLPQPETGSVHDARTTSDTRPPSGRTFRSGRDDGSERRPTAIVSSPTPDSSSG